MDKLTILTASLFLLSSFTSYASGEESKPYVMPYASETELAARQSPASLVPDYSSWRLQYPSGTASKGAITTKLNAKLKNRYFTKYTSADNKEYIRFSLDASDQGKTTNGSSVRVELAQSTKWALSGTHSMEYTFWGTCSDINNARFTIGQFLASQLPGTTPTDRPLCRIENEYGNLVAKIRNYYERDSVDTSNGDPITIDLGKWIPEKETTIKIETSDKTLTIYRDGVSKGSTTFTDKVRTDKRNYFKLGIYYQNKDSPKIFSEIYVRNLEVK